MIMIFLRSFIMIMIFLRSKMLMNRRISIIQISPLIQYMYIRIMIQTRQMHSLHQGVFQGDLQILHQLLYLQKTHKKNKKKNKTKLLGCDLERTKLKSTYRKPKVGVSCFCDHLLSAIFPSVHLSVFLPLRLSVNFLKLF